MEKGEREGVRLGFCRRAACGRWKGSGARADLVACLVGATARWLALHGCAIGGAEEGKKRAGKKRKGREVVLTCGASSAVREALLTYLYRWCF